MEQAVRLEPDTDPRVVTLRLDRPKVNAIDDAVVDGLEAACAELASSDSVRAVIVWGGPKVFAAGADITRFPDLDEAAATAFSARLNDVLLALENLPQITVSAVNGFCLGGGMELAMATDFRIAADDAGFGQPEILLGLIPGGGGTQRLPRLVGVTRAKELVYSGRRIDAAEAEAIGLVSSVHPATDVHDAALAMARRWADGPAALALAKDAILSGLHLPLDEAVALESQRFGACFATDDCRTGVASFLEHGPGRATFSGR